MNISFEIAKRYLFSRKSTNAINIITAISIIGIAVGTAALIISLSVFNGFEGLIKKYLDGYNPDIKVVVAEGKHFEMTEELMSSIKSATGVLQVSKVIEEVALLEYEQQQKAGIIKGVDDDYNNVTLIDSTMREGHFMTEAGGVDYGVLGYGLSTDLNVNMRDKITPIRVYLPKRGKKKKVFEKDFKIASLYPGGSFSFNNEDDNRYILASYEFVSKLMDRENLVSALEIKTDPELTAESIEEIQNILGDDFLVKDRFQQDETHLKIMNIEKWMSFLIVSLTLLIVAFNLIGSIWMIVLDKKKDISILKSMGITKQKVKEIFLTEGLLITGIGMIIGFVVAILLYFSQKNFGLVGIPEGFIVDAYPIELRVFDFVVVAFVVMLIGILASLGPAIMASRISSSIRNE